MIIGMVTLPVWAFLVFMVLSCIVGAGLAVIAISLETKRLLGGDRRL